ncbi:hypothetical protein V6N12_058628 [Hibiscus sabdariffa]|uniref:Uncharacterized protein n=1 Tax=Hibiscus sabdariffa TaxID=183260 RepID=A0ABR2EUI8_9ROSI
METHPRPPITIETATLSKPIFICNHPISNHPHWNPLQLHLSSSSPHLRPGAIAPGYNPLHQSTPLCTLIRLNTPRPCTKSSPNTTSKLPNQLPPITLTSPLNPHLETKTIRQSLNNKKPQISN